jgi:hypothetical protein
MKPSHNRLLRTVALCASIVAFAVTGATAQTELEKALKQYSAETVTGYIQPVADLFGADMHAGYYHNASIPETGFSLGFDIIVMGSVVQDAQKYYTANSPPGFAPLTFKAPTIFGGEATAVNHASIAGLQYKGSGGIVNTSIFPTVWFGSDAPVYHDSIDWRQQIPRHHALGRWCPPQHQSVYLSVSGGYRCRSLL